MVGKGCNGVVTVDGGVVDGHSKALEDAAQNERHVGNTISDTRLEFLLSPVHGLLAGYRLVDESNNLVSRGSARTDEILNLSSSALKIRLEIHNSALIFRDIEEAATVIEDIHTDDTFSRHNSPSQFRQKELTDINVR